MAGTEPRPRTDRLLERAGELAELHALLRAAQAGEPRLAVIEGPAGIGKSRLLAETRRAAAEDGMRVLGARASELEREFPFGIVRQLFEAVAYDEELAGRVLAGAAAAARPIFSVVEEGAGPDGDPSFAALHGLYWLTVNLAGEGPLLLAVDDLHWCDPPSLRFLAYLLRRLEEGLPVLVAGSLRPAEPGADAAVLAEIAQDPLVVSVRPAPLSAVATRELIAARLGAEPDRGLCNVVCEATHGNPLLVHELLKAMETEGVLPVDASIPVVRELGPRAASRAVLIRLARLPAETIAVARALAILGDEADLHSVAVLAELDDEAAAAATGALVQAEILGPEAPLGFVHPLVREAVYRDAPPGDRQRQHARAARLLADASAPEEQVASHMLAMPRRGDPWVVGTLRHAARVAIGRGAPESAAAYLRRAVDEPPGADDRTGTVFELGIAEGYSHGPAALDHLRGAYELATDPVERARIAVPLVRSLLFLGPPGEAAAITERSAAALGSAHGDLRRQLEALRLAVALFDPAIVPLDDPAFAQHRGPIVAGGLGARMLAGVAAYQWAMCGGPLQECVDLALRAIEDGTLLANDNGGVPHAAAMIVLIAADRDEAVQGLDASLASAHRSGSTFEAAFAYTFRGLAHLLRGDLVEAEKLLRTHVEMYADWGFETVQMFPISYIADTLVELGDLPGARTILQKIHLPAELPVASGLSWAYAARLRTLVASGANEDAIALADEYSGRFVPWIDNPAWVPWRSLKAEALWRLARGDEAVELAAGEVELARRCSGPRALGRALRVLGTVSGEPGTEHLDEALEVLGRSPARLELAKALLAKGRALRLLKFPTDAREPLRRALELASACEAAPVVEAAKTELYATGARPRSEALSGAASLTASERRVAGMAAEGQTNRDIAQALYVTPKTVEVHLSSAYRKLGIRSRRELSPALLA